MDNYNSETLGLVRHAVTLAARRDSSTLTPTESLQLDSIARIALVAELESAFDLELSAEDVVPEVFATLASLAAMIDARRT